MGSGLFSNQFNEKVFNLLDRVEYRRIQSWEDMEDVARLRATAYKAYNILPIKGELLIDDVDFDSNSYVFGIYYDEQLISTVRVHHVTPGHRVSAAGKTFPDAVNELLDAGMTLIDTARLAADLDAARSLPGLNFLTMRIATMASDFFDVDRCMSLIRPHHAPFYKRLFDFHTIVPTQDEKGYYNFPVTLVASNIRAARPWIYERYPFLRAHHYEMRLMFGALDEMPASPLTVLPTARYAAARALKAAPAHPSARARA